MTTRRMVAVSAAFLFLAAACSASGEETTTTTTGAAATTADAVSNPATTTPPETTAAPFTRLVDLAIDTPPWEDVTLQTDDGVELYARFWPGSETALLVGHDYSVTTAGAFGQRPDQSSEAVLLFTGTFAAQGYTVLSPDYRGHGQSGGEFEPQAGVIDLKAAYSFLTDRGFTKIVVVGWIGSGTTAVVLDATDDEVDFAGIALLFSPPQDHGMDANVALPELETPTFFIGSNAGTTASWARRMSNRAANSAGAFVFERVPTGLQFSDVFGPELIGRILEFADSV